MNSSADAFDELEWPGLLDCNDVEAAPLTNLIIADHAHGGDVANLKGYYNYLASTKFAPYWRRFYWGANYAALQRVKGRYDPAGVFSKPLTVEAPDP